MLPSILAKQLEKGIGDYIETSFPRVCENLSVNRKTS